MTIRRGISNSRSEIVNADLGSLIIENITRYTWLSLIVKLWRNR